MYKNKISQIRKKLMKADDAYYNKSEPIMSDEKYDRLKDAFRKLAPDDPYLKKVGAPVAVTEWKKEKHKIRMASLNKVNSVGEFVKWANGIGDKYYTIQDKLDGISIEMEYGDGNLKKGVTRGDGIVGEDIYNNVRRMKNVKTRISGFEGVLRGEIVLFGKDFEKINILLRKREGKEFKNPRNAASGISRKLDGENSEHLTILYYDISNGMDFKTEEEKMNFIESCGLKTCFWKKVTVKEAIEVYEEYDKKIRAELPYLIDGLVLKANDLKLQEKHGELHGNPKAQVAWKFGAVKKVSKVLDVKWCVGKSRRITPLIFIEPTEIGGVTVGKMTSHNLDIFNGLGLYKGCALQFKRANDVVPVPLKVMSKRNAEPYFKPPEKCPICKITLEIGDKFLICPNDNCEGLQIGNLEKWIITLDIKDIGEKIIEALYEAGKVKEPADFYRLSVDDIASLERMGEKSAKKILKHLHEKKEISLPIFIGGLNMGNFGRKTTEKLVEAGYDTVGSLFSLSMDNLVKIKGIEEKTAKLIIRGLNSKRKIIENLLKVGIRIKKEKKIVKDNRLNGKSFCFTGAINKVDKSGKRFTRKMMHDLVIEKGGKVETSVKKGLDYLVMADPNSTSSKAQKARKIGTCILSEVKFFEMVEG